MISTAQESAITPAQLLGDFIKAQAANYREPSRKGTPRGERVGFSYAKYYAALLALTETDLQDQAKKLHVSYDVLRKWRAEPEFKKMVDSHRHDFFCWLAFTQCKTSSTDLRVLADAWNNNFKEKKEHPKDITIQQKSSTNRLKLFLLADALKEGATHTKSWRELEVAALSQIIELLQDRGNTIRYRRDIANVLSTIKRNLTAEEKSSKKDSST